MLFLLFVHLSGSSAGLYASEPKEGEGKGFFNSSIIEDILGGRTNRGKEWRRDTQEFRVKMREGVPVAMLSGAAADLTTQVKVKEHHAGPPSPSVGHGKEGKAQQLPTLSQGQNGKILFFPLGTIPQECITIFKNIQSFLKYPSSKRRGLL